MSLSFPVGTVGVGPSVVYAAPAPIYTSLPSGYATPSPVSFRTSTLATSTSTPSLPVVSKTTAGTRLSFTGATATALPVAPPREPVALTKGMPEPSSIEKQKQEYLKMLDEQLETGKQTLTNHIEGQKKLAKEEAERQKDEVERQKREFDRRVDLQYKQAEVALTAQYNQEMMNLQQQANLQKATLEQQAMQLIMDFQQRKAEEELMKKQYEMQKEEYAMQMKLMRERVNDVPTSNLASPSFVPPSPLPTLRSPSYTTLPGASAPTWQPSQTTFLSASPSMNGFLTTKGTTVSMMPMVSTPTALPTFETLIAPMSPVATLARYATLVAAFFGAAGFAKSGEEIEDLESPEPVIVLLNTQRRFIRWEKERAR